MESPPQTASSFELSPPYLELRAQARDLANSLAGIAAEVDGRSTVDPRVRAALASSGLVRVMVPREFGGRDDRVDSLAITVVREQLAAQSGHLDSLFSMQGIGSYALAVGGNDQLRHAWLPRVATLEVIPALALTEPDIGSDLRNVTTRIKESGSELVVNGHKSFITNAGDADYYLVFGREDDGYSIVLVPAETSGVSVSQPHQVIAPHVLGDVVMDQVRVPVHHRVGKPGDGFDLALATLATFRVSVAGAAVGMAEAALREALRHTSSREQFGRPLAALGAVASLLAQSWTDLEMARSLTYRAAAAAAANPRANLHLSSMAKVGATEAASRVIDRSVQVMGRFGIIQDSLIERLYRGVRPMRIYEGSSEALFDSLAKRLVKNGLDT